MVERTAAAEPQYEAIIIGAGVCGIYQLYRLVELGVSTTVLEAGADLGGTWYWNRYPGARFDSESITLRLLVLRGAAAGVGLEGALLRPAGEPPLPELRRRQVRPAPAHAVRRARSSRPCCDDDATLWRLHLDDGRELTCRFLITADRPAVGADAAALRGHRRASRASRSTPTTGPRSRSSWPASGSAVIGTGATGVQVIGEIADKVGELTVFQRRPNWCAPLHNAEISAEEMADIKARYDEIFAICARTPGGFIHEPDRRPFFEVPREERLAKWEKLYGEPGFGIWLANFRDIFMDEEANAEFSEFIADKIRSRVARPGRRREADPQGPRLRRAAGPDGDPLLRGVQPRQRAPRRPPGDADRAHHADAASARPSGEYEFDVIVYATGFDAVTGAYDRIDIRGVGGQSLREKWADGPDHATSACTSPASRT